AQSLHHQTTARSCALYCSAPQRTPAAKAAIFTGTYAITAGLALLAFPVTSFGLLFDASAVPTVWIRVGGTLFALIGYQYLGTGMADSPLVNKDGQVYAGPLYARSFYMSSVFSRLFLVAVFVALVATKQSPVNLLVLACLNLLGAVSMFFAISKLDACFKLQA
ncbi:hypothetical protein QJQ45_029051, partial [Haematococcus lacustris]